MAMMAIVQMILRMIFQGWFGISWGGRHFGMGGTWENAIQVKMKQSKISQMQVKMKQSKISQIQVKMKQSKI